jgi:hypothetical protein
MSSDDPNLKRMGVVLMLIIYVFTFNVIQAVMLNVEEPYNEMLVQGQEYSGGIDTITISENPSILPSIDIFGFLFSFCTFFFGGFIVAIETFPLWMSLIMMPIYIFMLIGFWFIIIDYVKDISILGSSV